MTGGHMIVEVFEILHRDWN